MDNEKINKFLLITIHYNINKLILKLKSYLFNLYYIIEFINNLLY